MSAVRAEVLLMILNERLRQIEMYGTNAGLPLGFGGTVAYPWLTPFSTQPASTVCEQFRLDYAEYEANHGATTWMHLIREEVAELFEADGVDNLITEAIQVAALCVSLVERLLAENRGDKS